jgi:hypothetical protein
MIGVNTLNFSKQQLLSMGMVDVAGWFGYLDISIRIKFKWRIESFDEANVTIVRLEETTGVCSGPYITRSFRKALLEFMCEAKGNQIEVSRDNLLKMGFISTPSNVSMIRVLDACLTSPKMTFSIFSFHDNSFKLRRKNDDEPWTLPPGLSGAVINGVVIR